MVSSARALSLFFLFFHFLNDVTMFYVYVEFNILAAVTIIFTRDNRDVLCSPCCCIVNVNRNIAKNDTMCMDLRNSSFDSKKM